MKHALDIIGRYKCNYVADMRTGFENITEDTKWVADYFKPKAVEYGCRCICFMINKTNVLKEESERQEENYRI